MTCRIALVAHDACKPKLIAWASEHQQALSQMHIYATGTTGARLAKETGLQPNCLLSGPLGGDAQLGAMIAEGGLDALMFFIDPLTAVPHDVDVKTLLRLAILYDVRVAVNRSSATAVLHSLEAKDIET